MSELTMNSDKAIGLQTRIRKELAAKGYSTEADTVMAEYITIMLINSKTPDQITEELKDLIGEEYDPAFTDWLFQEKLVSISHSDSSGAEPNSAMGPGFTAPAPASLPSTAPGQSITKSDATPRHIRAIPLGQSRPLINQALSSLPTGTSFSTMHPTSAQKRPASRRSSSPNGPAPKKRHSDLPDRPRAMRDETANGTSGSQSSVGVSTTTHRRSLLDRVGAKSKPLPPSDHVQEHIDAITQQHQHQLSQTLVKPAPFLMPSMGNPGPASFPMMQAQSHGPLVPGFVQNPPGGTGSMDATMMAISQIGHIALQLGLVPGLNGSSNPMINQSGNPDLVGRAQSNFRGSAQYVAPHLQHQKPAQVTATGPVIQQGLSTMASTTTPPTNQLSSMKLSPPSRPGSPTLCKFATACTNAFCRYSHPSPVATVESGVVLSTEPCAKGLNCDDKDCLNAHASKAAKDPQNSSHTTPFHPPSTSNTSHINCRFGAHCTRPDCAFSHPPHRAISGASSDNNTLCRFGAACTKVTCPFKHPPGRVLPSQFSKGLDGAPPTTVGSLGVNRESESRNRTVDFRKRNASDEAERSSTPSLNAAAKPFVPLSVSPQPSADEAGKERTGIPTGV